MNSSNQISYTSFSRLESYKKCPEYHNLKYIQRLEEEQPFNKYLALGKLVHSVIAEILDDTETTKEEAFYYHLGGWLEEQGIRCLDPDDITEYIKPAADLLWRASVKCKDDRGIRKDSGELLQDPANYPNKVFKNLCNEKGISQNFDYIDKEASKENPSFTEESLSWLIAKAYFMSVTFEVPNKISKSVHIETGISTNEDNIVLIPGTNTAFRAYIDWVVETNDDRLALLDHKTSKNKPSAEQVLLNPQLNIYAWLYQRVYGRLPELIGINHLETGEPIVVRTDEDIVQSYVRYYSELQKAVETGHHFKHDPNEFNSPCIKKEWKSGKVRESCPFLSHCHPIYTSIYSTELNA